MWRPGDSSWVWLRSSEEVSVAEVAGARGRGGAEVRGMEVVGQTRRGCG